MRNNLKKWLAAILCIAMALTLLPASLAEQDDPETPTLTPADDRDAEKADRIAPGFVNLTLSEEPKDEAASAEPKSNIFNETDLKLGLTSYSVSAGDTVYRKFTAPSYGVYRFYSMTEADTCGTLLNASKEVILTDDDSGYDRNFMLRVLMNAGGVVYVGASYYGSTTSGYSSVIAEKYERDDTPLVCGYNAVSITQAGETLYRPFTPTASDFYTVYSAAQADTFGKRTRDSGEVCQYDDDSGYSQNFMMTYYLEAGKTYNFGVNYYSADKTGTIPVVIERRVTNSTALHLGLNWVEIAKPDTTMYRSFTSPAAGMYRFYSTSQYKSGTIQPDDTFGTLANDSMAVSAFSDSHGYGESFMVIGNLEAGDTCYVGARYKNASATGSFPVIAERPVFRTDALQMGTNTFPVTAAGDTIYRPFTSTESGVYKIYSTGSKDTLGTFMNNQREVLFYDDDSKDGSNFCFTAEMTAGQTYHIGVRFYDNSSTGNLSVVIEKEAVFDGTIEWNSSDVQYRGTTPYVIANGSAQTPRFTVKAADGSVVNPSHYTYQYRENTNAGTGYVIVTFKDVYYGTAQAWFKIYLPATAKTSVENIETGIQISWAAVTGAAGYVIYRRAWSSKTNGWTSFERWNNTTDLCWTDLNVYAGSRYQYGVKAYFTRRIDPVSGATIGGNVGDNYNLGIVGPLKTNVRITTRKLTSLKAGSKQITADWEGSSKFTGYEIRYATNAAFTQNAKTTRISNPKTYSTTLKSLTNNTEYFVSVRSYHVFEGMTYYGQWSNILSVKPGSGQTAHYGPNMALLIGEVDYHGTATDRACGLYDTVIMSGMLQGLYNRFEPTVKTNQNKADVVNAIRSAYTDTTDGSVSVFFFSGHGSGENYGAAGLYCCDGLTLSYKDLAAELNSSVKGRVIVILCCCHRGASINKSASEYDEDANLAAAIEAFSGYTLDTGSGTRSGEFANSKFIVIAAAPSAEVSWSENHVGFDGSGYPQSALTASIVNGVGARYPDGGHKGGMPANTDSNGEITLKELYTYSYNAVYGWTENVSGEGYSGPQHVQYYGPDGEILFRRK